MHEYGCMSMDVFRYMCRLDLKTMLHVCEICAAAKGGKMAITMM